MNLDQYIQNIFSSDLVSISPIDAFASVLIPFLISFIITKTHSYTQFSDNYQQSYIHSLILFCILTSVITMIIGSNIARAFGLIGALSIIRFRTAVKSHIDSVYTFWSLAVGMACGTGFYLHAAFFSLAISLIMIGLYHFNYGNKAGYPSLLKVTFELDKEADIENKLSPYLKSLNVVNKSYSPENSQQTNVYSVYFKKDSSMKSFYEFLEGDQEIIGHKHYNDESTLFS
jgi:uncharacterized membrane protein YhiD involved in acid resistance